jgi:gliding motility-associated-like protein
VDSTIFNIDVNDFTVYAGNDTTIQEGSYVLLNASQAASYQWSPPDFLSNTNTNPTLSVPLTTITYTLTAYDNNGCKAQDSIIITVLQDCGKQIVPSSFTPNGDGKNDLFRILSQYDFNLIDFTIYNRWGQNIFYTTNTSIGWDGTLSNNTPAEIGVYVYIIRYLCNGAEKMIKGNVTLLR